MASVCQKNVRAVLIQMVALARSPWYDALIPGEAVADLRATAARYPDDPDLADLLDDLLSGSELFRRLWEEGRVEVRRTSTKTFDHPQVGPLCLDCDVLLLPDSDQRVIVYSAAPVTTAAHALDLLRVISTQDWATPS